MRSVGIPRTFVYERWVEGPLEGMDDLSRGLDKETEGMKAIMGVSAFVLFSFLLILFISLVVDIRGLVNAQNMFYQLTGIVVSLLYIVLTIAAGVMAMQVLSFMAASLARFESVDDLFSGFDPSISKALDDLKENKELREFNLFWATSTFTNGVVENLPNASKRMTYIRLVFLFIPLYFWARMLFLPMLFSMDIVLFPSILEGAFTIYVLVMSIMSIVAGVMIVEVARLMQVVLSRMNFLDHIKNAAPRDYSIYNSGPERLLQFLQDSDWCYGKARKASGKYIVQHASDQCLVLATMTPSPPSMEMVKGFWEDVKSFVKKQSFVPNKARFIILYTPDGAGEEISDEVTQFILSNPIQLGQGPGDAKSETALQIIIEEGETYSFLPFVE